MLLLFLVWLVFVVLHVPIVPAAIKYSTISIIAKLGQ